MNIQFMSQAMFKNTINCEESSKVVLNNSVAISIVTEQKDTFKLNNNFHKSIQLVFEDSETSFTNEQAQTIIDLAKYAISNSIQTVYVHCLLGVSRSAAVALFLEEMINGVVIEDIQRSSYSNYNRSVYSKLIYTLQGFFDANPST